MTDYASHKFWELKPEYVDRYFVANNQMKYGLVNNGISRGKIFVTGIPIGPRFLEQHDRMAIYNEFNLDSQKKTILLFGGGEYGLSSVKDIFLPLLELQDDFQVIAIAGKNKRTLNMFKELASATSKTVIILSYTDKVPELMSIADFVISKPGGLTTTEILVSNVPFIIINPIPGQEEENANFLLNSGAAVRLFNTKKAAPFLDEILHNEIRLENIKEMQRVIAKPNSTKDIVETIMQDI